MAIKRFNLTKHSKVIEIASNDGYLLQYFKKKISRHWELNPKNVAEIAIKQGIPTHVNFSVMT